MRERPSRRRAASRSTASPIWCPRSSLTRLKWSRSSSTSEKRRPWRPARTTSCASRSWKVRWLARPVRWSVAASEASRARALGVAHRDAHELGEARQPVGRVGERAAGGDARDPDRAPQALARAHRRRDHRVGPAGPGGSRALEARRPPGAGHRRRRPLALEPLALREGRRGAGQGPGADGIRRAVALEAHQPAAGRADQAHGLLADQVEDRLGIVLQRDRGGDAAQGALLVGEPAVLGLPAAQLQLGGVARGDVQHHRGDHRRRLRAHQLHPHLDRVRAAVAAPVDGLELHPLDVAAAQRLDDGLEGAGVQLGQEVEGGHLEQLLHRVAAVGDGAPVDLHEPQGARVEDVGLVARLGQDPPQAAHHPLLAAALRDVREAGDDRGRAGRPRR